MRNLLLLLASFLFVIASCSKKETIKKPAAQTQAPDPYAPDTQRFTIFNATDSVIIFNLYNNISDYTNSANVVFTTMLQPKQSVYATPFISKYAYFDWYTTGFTISNWSANRNLASAVTDSDQRITLERDTFAVNPRGVYISNNQPATTWHAVDAYEGNSNSSVWDTLAEVYRSVKLVLRKDLTYSLAMGSWPQLDGPYGIGKSKEGNYYITNLLYFPENGHGGTQATLTPVRYVDSNGHLPHFISGDTLILNHYGHPSYYILVKVP